MIEKKDNMSWSKRKGYGVMSNMRLRRFSKILHHLFSKVLAQNWKKLSQYLNVEMFLKIGQAQLSKQLFA